MESSVVDSALEYYSRLIDGVGYDFVIKRSEKGGKGMYSTKYLESGTELIEDVPILSFLSQLCDSEGVCSFCLGPISKEAQIDSRCYCSASKSSLFGSHSGEMFEDKDEESSDDFHDHSRHSHLSSSHSISSSSIPHSCRFCSEKCRDNALKSGHSILCPLSVSSSGSDPSIGSSIRDIIEKLDSYGPRHTPFGSRAISQVVCYLAAKFAMYSCDFGDSLTPQQCLGAATQVIECLYSAPAAHAPESIDYEGLSRDLKIIISSYIKQTIPKSKDEHLQPYKLFLDTVCSVESIKRLTTLICCNSQALEIKHPSELSQSSHSRSIFGTSSSSSSTFLTITDGSSVGGSSLFGVEQGRSEESPDHSKTVLGIGLFTFLSQLNHSCTPNCEIVSTHNHSCVLRVLESVRPDEELTISYIPLENGVKRREELLRPYLFTCQCKRCQFERREEKE
ncbi:hypothetical protein ADUPG1_008126 [Aduncisulcus paluster]|uniref:SET domain-containing protein n=1 Tax=Aduncisulcus paluster TaxID=2918883 RepID=A0ABQ5KQT5_9EUKA|nr:hypothetical protein ADUPG1_008126 [Aduncisulcus paluster]